MADDKPRKKTPEEIYQEQKEAAEAEAKAKAAALMPPAGAPLMAARVGDMHVCPMVNPNLSPHVGGSLLPPGVPTVLIGGQPAATVGNMGQCQGPPNSVVKGSATVMIGGKPAARMMDSMAHGGMIVKGFPTVLIGG